MKSLAVISLIALFFGADLSLGAPAEARAKGATTKAALKPAEMAEFRCPANSFMTSIDTRIDTDGVAAVQFFCGDDTGKEQTKSRWFGDGESADFADTKDKKGNLNRHSRIVSKEGITTFEYFEQDGNVVVLGYNRHDRTIPNYGSGQMLTMTSPGNTDCRLIGARVPKDGRPNHIKPIFENCGAKVVTASTPSSVEEKVETATVETDSTSVKTDDSEDTVKKTPEQIAADKALAAAAEKKRRADQNAKASKEAKKVKNNAAGEAMGS